MSTIRTLLEEIKRLDDARRHREGAAADEIMALYTPGSPDAIAALLNGGWSHPLPASFGEFLAASDGITKFRGRLDFLSTDPRRQEPLKSIIAKKVEQDSINLRALFKVVDDSAIQKWESEPKRFYVANHPVIAASQLGGLLFYDSRTRDRGGEMQLCWRSATKAIIEKRYANILEYLQEELEGARQ